MPSGRGRGGPEAHEARPARRRSAAPNFRLTIQGLGRYLLPRWGIPPTEWDGAGARRRPVRRTVLRPRGRCAGRRGCSAAAPAIICAAMLGFVSAASAAPVIVGEPTILGPTSSVHDVPGEGYEGNTLYWVLTRGLEEPEVNAALWEAALPEGIYQVEAWIPLKQGYTYARYDITHTATRAKSDCARPSSATNGSRSAHTRSMGRRHL